MCGIAGVVSFVPGNVPPVEPMLASLKHRGPDGDSTWSDDRCSLGQARLAIIDLSPAGQAPLSNEDGTQWVTFNGEIYNFREVRRDLERFGHRFRSQTDTEVIVHAYEEWGPACVKRFRGMFALAIWDQRAGRLFLARDRVGKKPLYFTRQRDHFYFASELQGLLALPQIKRDPDHEALQAYLSWGYIPAPLTGFQGILKLEPGHHLSLDVTARDPSPKIERYWRLSYANKTQLDEDEAAHEVRRRVTEAVRLRMISDVPLGAFLSGGIDSSIVVAVMAELSSTPVKTFSIGFEEAAYDELHHARRIAERWGTEHHEHVVEPNALEVLPLLARHFGEPFADSSAVPTYYLSKLTRRDVTVALNGDGGDESFAGYDRYRAEQLAGRWGRLPGLGMVGVLFDRLAPHDPKHVMRRGARFLEGVGRPHAERYSRWMSYFTAEEKAPLCTPEFLAASGRLSTADWFDGLAFQSDASEAAEVAMSTDVSSYLPYDLLVKVDIASMASSLEARSPFLDHEVMEFAATLPLSMKLSGQSSKRILRKAFDDVLPKANVNRRKMGFGVPLAAWLRGTAKDALNDVLLSDSALGRGYFVEAELRSLIKDHQEGHADNAARLWNLLVLETWQREVVDVPTGFVR